MFIIQKLKFYLKKILDTVGAFRALGTGRDVENRFEKNEILIAIHHLFYAKIVFSVLILSFAMLS